MSLFRNDYFGNVELGRHGVFPFGVSRVGDVRFKAF
jgi:hypothetical protein